MIKTVHSKVLNHDKKTIAFTVMQLKSKSMDKHRKASSAFGVKSVGKLLFIKELILNAFDKNDGLIFGSKKVTRSEDFQNFPDTAPSKLSKLKIIGSLKPQVTIPISQRSNMLFTTALTLGKTTALLPL
ncbi:MAG: hypothetical protein WC437_04340 [Patescibacteria group bacterium]